MEEDASGGDDGQTSAGERRKKINQHRNNPRLSDRSKQGRWMDGHKNSQVITGTEEERIELK